MKCRNCGHTYDGEFCPVCGLSQDSGGWKKTIIPLIFAAVFFISVFVFSKNRSGRIEAPPEFASAPAAQGQASGVSAPPDSPEAEEISFPDIFDSFSVEPEPEQEPEEEFQEDESHGWTAEGYEYLIIDGVKLTEMGFVQSKGESYLKPEAGNIFVIFEFTIENNTGSAFYIFYTKCEAYFDDYAVPFSIRAAGKKDVLNGKLADGKKMRGVLSYEVPEDWKSAELIIPIGNVCYRITRDNG